VTLICFKLGLGITAGQMHGLCTFDAIGWLMFTTYHLH